MKIVVWKSPKALSGILRRLFHIQASALPAVHKVEHHRLNSRERMGK